MFGCEGRGHFCPRLDETLSRHTISGRYHSSGSSMRFSPRRNNPRLTVYTLDTSSIHTLVWHPPRENLAHPIWTLGARTEATYPVLVLAGDCLSLCFQRTRRNARSPQRPCRCNSLRSLSGLTECKCLTSMPYHSGAFREPSEIQ